MSKQLNDSVDTTIKMADNLITWAMVQMGESQFNEETIKVKDITANILDVYQNIAIEKGININFSVDNHLTIIGDKNQIEFVIRNLVNNAIKFTSKNGFVSLTAKLLTDGHVQISVSDSGIGISDDYKKELFSISKKQSMIGTDGEKGTGLGLMLSYEFMKLNGGQIEMESSLGIGSTFHAKFKRGQEVKMI
jgi:signal transduction histidine kinase